MSLKHSPAVGFLRKKIAGKIKSLIYFFLNLFWGYLPKNKAAVLMYHSIGNNPVFFTVSSENFERQMEYLFQNKYNVASLNQLAEYIKEKNIPEKTVVLTFDDGFEDNYNAVLPVLRKYNFPASIFLAVGSIGEEIPNSANFPLKALDWKQIQEMHNSGLIDFQPHTVNHPKLNRVSDKEAEKEIAESKRIIEENLKKQCRFFAYPKGYYTGQTKDILKKQGFALAFTIREGLAMAQDNAFELKRNSIDSSVGMHQFLGKISMSVSVFRKIFKA